MQRINRSPHTPVGTALFLFVRLAIIPVSLRAAGVQISFAPRLTAANDAWQQIAEVFGAGYRPSTPDQSVVKRETSPSNADENFLDNSGLVCSHNADESPWPQSKVSKPPSVKPTLVRKSKVPSARALSVNQSVVFSAPVTINASFEKIIPMVSELGALKVAKLRRAQLIKGIDKGLLQPSFQPF